MQMTLGSINRPRGELAIRKLNATVPAPLGYTLRNRLRLSFLFGWLMVQIAHLFSKVSGLPVLVSNLQLKKRTWSHEAEGLEYLRLLKQEGRDAAEAFAERHAHWIDYGVVCYRVVTNNGVGAIVDAFQNTFELENMNYHGIGTGTNAENATDTALQTESTTALNPDSTRATGVQTEPASNQYRSVGTLTADGTIAATEHGLFSQAATGGGVLFDRSVFSVINVGIAETLQTTYTLTVTSGG
jgi:hypothetical protein